MVLEQRCRLALFSPKCLWTDTKILGWIDHADVIFAFFHNKFRGSWVYGPLAVPGWRIAFPLATLPCWALLAQLSVWRDDALDSSSRSKSSTATVRRLGVGAFVKVAVIATLLAAPLAYLTHGTRVRAVQAAMKAAAAASGGDRLSP
eukprot:COSAG02_NODE_5120_length_4612_cov_1.983160_2_plen_147_part_00